MRSVGLVVALAFVLAGCGGKKAASPDDVAACLYKHGGAATSSQNVAAETRGIPGRATAVLEFSFPEHASGFLTHGAVFFERTDADAAIAYRALRHLDVAVPKVTGVSLKQFPKIDLVRSGDLQRHDRKIVLWINGSRRSARTTRAVSACLTA